MRWCSVHGRWENDAIEASAAPQQAFGFQEPLSVLIGAHVGAPVASTMPAFPTMATPTFSAAPAPGYASPQQRGLSGYTVAPPPRAMPSGAAEAPVSSGPPAWFNQADAAVNRALGSVDGVLAVLSRHSAAERAADVFYLDRLTESLQKWAAKMQEMADPFRKKRFH